MLSTPCYQHPVFSLFRLHFALRNVIFGLFRAPRGFAFQIFRASGPRWFIFTKNNSSGIPKPYFLNFNLSGCPEAQFFPFFHSSPVSFVFAKPADRDVFWLFCNGANTEAIWTDTFEQRIYIQLDEVLFTFFNSAMGVAMKVDF